MSIACPLALAVAAALLVSCSSSSPRTAGGKPTYEMSPREVDAKLKALAAEPTPAPLPDRTIALARQNLGQPYDLYLLGEAPFETVDPQPLYNLQKSDCVVFVEHTLAMALSPDFPSFLRLLQRIRYADGQIGVRTRNHYTEADWNVSNAWLLKDITADVSPVPPVKYAQRVNRQAFFKQRYKLDVQSPVQRIEETYVPDEAIASVRGLRTGDVFESVKGSPKGGGEFVHHLGFITVTPEGEVHMLHSTEPRVCEQTIASYIEDARKREGRIATTRPNQPVHKGFKFFRLNEDALARLKAIDGTDAPKVAVPADAPTDFEAYVRDQLGGK